MLLRSSHASGLSRLLCRIEPGKQRKGCPQQHKDEYASFRADRAAGKPARTLMEGGIEEVSCGQETAVRNGVDERLRIVGRGMEADGKPEVSGTLQGKAGKQPEHYD